jgi:hypothetical protein
MADAGDLNSLARKGVWVRLPPVAPGSVGQGNCFVDRLRRWWSLIAPMTWKQVILALGVAVLVLVGGCAGFVYSKTDPTRPSGLIDALHVPASYRLVGLAKHENAIMLSHVARYYQVAAEPEATTAELRGLLTAAGWDVTSGSCGTNGPVGPVRCYLLADRGSDRLLVDVWDRYRGLKEGYQTEYRVGDDDYSVVEPDRVVVRIMIDY